MNTIPDKWCLVKVAPDLVKVMATWSGGYLDGDSWKLNSGIERIEETEDSYLFHGASGSIYECRKTAYGINAYGFAVLRGAKLWPIKEAGAKRYIKAKLNEDNN